MLKTFFPWTLVVINLVNSVSSHFNYTLTPKWPVTDHKLGQITAIEIDHRGNIVIFHRGPHVWNERTFDHLNNYRLIDEGPISISTVITIDPVTMKMLHGWGSDFFYLPHGLTFDTKGFVWLTDVALHQVFKFPAEGAASPLLTLGEKFVPGSDNEHFCKPTSVAIDSRSGEFYVADGYCNSRVIRFSPEGKFLNRWGHQDIPSPITPAPTFMNIPHKIILAEDQNLACIADREHGRIQCFITPDGEFKFIISHKEFHGRLFSISYSPFGGGVLYAVNGPSFYGPEPVKAFLFNLTTHELLTSFGEFKQPHDIAATSDGKNVYVVEIGPNYIWRFERELPHDINILPNSSSLIKTPASQLGAQEALSPKKNFMERLKISVIPAPFASFSNTSVIIVLLILPILVVIFLAFVISFRRDSRPRNYSPLKDMKEWVTSYKATKGELNLGRILNDPKRSGFNQLAMEDSDNEAIHEDDSEVEEFNINSLRKI